jgi:hypothetical protein
MSHNFIDDNGAFPRTIAEINDVLKIDPDARMKPLLATVKGSGGGKTRLLEETRRALNKREDTLAIGVTFNSNTTYSVGENRISETDTLPLHFDAVLSVMTRIVAVLYQEPFDDVINAFSESAHNLDRKKLYTDRNLAKFFRSFLNAVMDTLVARDHGGKLKNLVLLVDEVMRPLDATRRSLQSDGIAEKNLISSQFNDFLSALNQGVLNERLGGATGREWNTALLISSLEVSPLEKTLSGRSIILLPTGVLSSQSIVYEWWRQRVNIEPSAIATAKLTLLAEMLKTIPRLVENTNDFLVNKEKESSTSAPLKIDAALIRPLFQHLLRKVEVQFSVPDNINPQKLFGLVYGRKVYLDQESIYLMRTSFFTNTLDRIREKDVTLEFVPQGNLVMLAFYDQDRLKSLYGNSILETDIEWNDPERVFLNVYLTIINSTVNKGSEGDALEKATLGWIMARLIAAQKAGIKEMPLHEFLAVSEDSLRIGEAPPIHVKIPTAIGLDDKVFEDQAFSVLPTISNNFEKFADEFNKIQLGRRAVVKVFRTGQFQNCDFMVVFRIGDTGELFILFIDNKCKQPEIYVPNTDPPRRAAKTVKLKQFSYVEKFVEELGALEKKKIELSPMSNALVKGNYRFVFLTTHPEVELQHNGEKVEQKPDRLVVMSAKESKNFFGILWDLYKAARGLHDATVFDEKGNKLTEKTEKFSGKNTQVSLAKEKQP